MNFIHHIKPRLLLSCPYPAGKQIYLTVAKPWQNRHRAFTALAESRGAEHTIATQAIPPSSVHSNSRPAKNSKNNLTAKTLHFSKKIQISSPGDHAQPQRFSDMLRLQRAIENKKKREQHAKTSSVIKAAAEAISRDHANQNDIIKWLQKASIPSDKRSKRRAKENKKKPKYVDTSALSKTFVAEKAPERECIKPTEKGWTADEWQDRGWGKDGMHLAASTLFIMQ